MKQDQVCVAAAVVGICLTFSSCGELNKPLAGGGMLMSPAMYPSGLGGLKTTEKFHTMHVAAATAEQRRTAEMRAKTALMSAEVNRRLQQEKVRYVAVPVNRTKAQVGRGTPIMKVNVSTGASTGEVFVTETGIPQEGEKIKLGGDSTLYFATTGDKL